MPTKDLELKPFTKETLTKLEIFEKYLEAWLPVFLHSNYVDTVNIIDFFAGSGTDLNGILGSPLRIINIINSYSETIIKKGFRINIILNEYEKKKYEKLKINIENKLNHTLKNNVKIQIYIKDFKELFYKISPNIINETNLLFLDQNGIKQITKEILLTLDECTKTDFLFFISSSYFLRFKNEESFNKFFPDLYIPENAEALQIHNIILKYYKNMLPFGSYTKLYPFSIKKKQNIYGLVFGSKHPLGVDKFLNIAWNKNKLNGEANFDINDDSQSDLFSNTKPKLNKFQSELENYILEKNRTNKEVYDFTLENGHISKHATEKVAKMKLNKKIQYSGHTCISYDKCYKTPEIKIFSII